MVNDGIGSKWMWISSRRHWSCFIGVIKTSFAGCKYIRLHEYEFMAVNDSTTSVKYYMDADVLKTALPLFHLDNENATFRSKMNKLALVLD